MRHLPDMLSQGQSGVMLFSITPPRRSATEERVREIAEVTLARLAGLDVDGLILYDIDDESDRIADERPFPYLPTMDPAVFHAEHLAGWDRPAVIYRCVGKYDEDDLRSWLAGVDAGRVLSVFVGASSSDKPVRTNLRRAQALRDECRPDLPLGAVVIGDRHEEHLRMLAKQDRGCSFFITQVIYDRAETEKMLTAYALTCSERGLAPRPVIFTLSLCGSPKTLEFLEWLGVSVPPRVHETLRTSPDPIADSSAECLAIARYLIDCCTRLGVPFGFNVESVSIRKAEIEAAIRLTAEVSALLRGI
ncbi:MAG: 5,10-methylenetetrahydrofolate reductase [Actinoplanes sp.]